jgi:hypothetical protein
MTQAVYPVSDVINVTITETPSGLPVPNVNSVAIFTNDAPINGEVYGIYTSPSQVAANYGTGTDTANMANNVFAQVPNLLSGAGQLVVIPMLAAVSATHGNFQSANISANLAGFAAVNNGSMNVVLDGTAVTLNALNFTGATTWAQVAAVIQAALVDGLVMALANGIEIISKKIGTSSTVTLATGGTGTDITGAAFLHQATGTSVAGANSTGEAIAACIARTAPLVAYVGILLRVDIEDAAIIAAAPTIMAGNYVLLVPRAQTKDIAGIATTVQQATQTRVRVLVYTPSFVAAKLYSAAYAGAGFSVDFTGSNTSQTLNLRALTNVTPDTGLSETLKAAAMVAGVDIYISYAGVPSVVSTGGNMYFDNIYSDLAVKFALQTAYFNYLRQTNTKIPQTEPGMNGAKDALRGVCNQFVNNGCWAPGAWNSSEFFGTPALLVSNVATKGFYIYSLPVAQQAESDRQNRVAPLIQIAGKRAGAQHTGSVLVNIND